jgi:hypothetical protein
VWSPQPARRLSYLFGFLKLLIHTHGTL